MVARFAIFESALTGPDYRVENFRFLKSKNNFSFLKIFGKNHKKKSYLENDKK